MLPKLKLCLMLEVPLMLALISLAIAQVVVHDPETGDELPEELNDGELEATDHETHWSYLNQELWPKEYPLCKGLNLRQSPIDIITSTVKYRPAYKLEFIEYDQKVEFMIRNTNHSVSLTPIPTEGTIPSIRLSWLAGDNLFELQEIHIHWGSDVTKGSEHRLNGAQAGAEMHFVHYRKGVAKKDIGNISNSVLVLGVMVQPGRVDYNKLEIIAKNVFNINGTSAEFAIQEPFLLTDLLPTKYQAFFTYEGSLTTPPCYEIVTWIVLRQPIFILRDLLNNFINLVGYSVNFKKIDRKIGPSFRLVQPLNKRPVYASFNSVLIDLPPPPMMAAITRLRTLLGW